MLTEHKNTIDKIMGKIIYLRKIAESDVTQKYVDWLNSPEINKYLESRFKIQTKEDILSFVKDKLSKDNEPMFAICDTNSNEHIGNIKLGPINPYHKYASIGILIGDKNYWGKGCATEAIKLITKYGFETLKLNKLDAGAYSENCGSINAFKKAGYSQEGLLKKQVVSGEKKLDVVLLGITAEDYWQNNKE